MKTTKMMMSAMFAMMMSMMAMSASAATNNNQVVSGRGQHRTIEVECYCKQCQKVRKQMDKHMHKHHYGMQNRMACRECMIYSQKLNSHKRYEVVSASCNDRNCHNCNHNNFNNGHNNNHDNNNGHNNNRNEATVYFGRR